MSADQIILNRSRASTSLLRAGRICIDVAAFVFLAPVVIVATIATAVAVGMMLFGLLSLAFSGLSTTTVGIASTLLSPAMWSAAVLALATTAALTAAFSLARTGRPGTVLLLLLAIPFAPAIFDWFAHQYEWIFMEEDMNALPLLMRVLIVLLTVAAPILTCIGIALILAASTVRLRSRHVGILDWPATALSMFAARHGIWRWKFWSTVAFSVLRIFLSAVGLTLLLILIIGAGVLAGQAFGQFTTVDPALEQVIPLQIATATFCLVTLVGLAIVCVRQRRVAVVPALLILIHVVVLSEISVATVRSLLGDPGGAQFDFRQATMLVVLFGGFALRGLVTVPFAKSLRRARQAASRTAKELSARRKEAPILFLRSFLDDNLAVQTDDAATSFAMAVRRDKARIEELLCLVLFAKGPLVALADPAVRQSPLGVARDRAEMDDWQQNILDYMDRAQIIVCCFGQTPSFLWEIEQIISRGALHKTVLLFPPSYLEDRWLVESASKLAARMDLADVEEERRLMAGARAMAYNASNQKFEVFASDRADSIAYLDAIVSCAAVLGSKTQRSDRTANPAMASPAV